jgi:hypothetical protein
MKDSIACGLAARIKGIFSTRAAEMARSGANISILKVRFESPNGHTYAARTEAGRFFFRSYLVERKFELINPSESGSGVALQTVKLQGSLHL